MKWLIQIFLLIAEGTLVYSLVQVATDLSNNSLGTNILLIGLLSVTILGVGYLIFRMLGGGVA